MGNGFSFDRALSFPFKAAHASSFPWIFSAAFGLLGTMLTLFILYLASGDIADVVRDIEALENSQIDGNDPAAVLEAVFGILSPLLSWGIIGAMASWITWAMFESASQRRYIRDERFYLAFGGDEVRMMGVGFMWWLLQAVIFFVPVMMIFRAVMGSFALLSEGAPDDEIAAQVTGPILGATGLMFLLFPVYVFLATRLAPCFGLTIKDREFRFFDAWHVSRGRFWPILGAYLIIAILGGIIVSVVEQMAQFPLTAALLPSFETVDNAEDLLRVMGSMGVVLPFAIYMFARLFMSGLLMHFAGGPAAFAARHDPRGGVDDAHRADIFS